MCSNDASQVIGEACKLGGASTQVRFSADCSESNLDDASELATASTTPTSSTSTSTPASTSADGFSAVLAPSSEQQDVSATSSATDSSKPTQVAKRARAKTASEVKFGPGPCVQQCCLYLSFGTVSTCVGCRDGQSCSCSR